MHEYSTIYPTPTDVTGNRTIEIRLITKCTGSKLEKWILKILENGSWLTVWW